MNRWAPSCPRRPPLARSAPPREAALGSRHPRGAEQVVATTQARRGSAGIVGGVAPVAMHGAGIEPADPAQATRKQRAHPETQEIIGQRPVLLRELPRRPGAGAVEPVMHATCRREVATEEPIRRARAGVVAEAFRDPLLDLCERRERLRPSHGTPPSRRPPRAPLTAPSATTPSAALPLSLRPVSCVE